MFSELLQIHHVPWRKPRSLNFPGLENTCITAWNLNALTSEEHIGIEIRLTVLTTAATKLFDIFKDFVHKTTL